MALLKPKPYLHSKPMMILSGIYIRALIGNYHGDSTNAMKKLYKTIDTSELKLSQKNPHLYATYMTIANDVWTHLRNRGGLQLEVEPAIVIAGLYGATEHSFKRHYKLKATHVDTLLTQCTLSAEPEANAYRVIDDLLICTYMRLYTRGLL